MLTNTAPTAVYRSAGRPEVIHMIERLIDLAADEHGFDRVALRRAPDSRVGSLVRLRGDVILNACIGGSGANACTGTRTAANTISGEITNLDFHVPDQDNWHRYHAGDLERVALKGTTAGRDAAPIEADGSFHGAAQADPEVCLAKTPPRTCLRLDSGSRES